MTDVFVGVFSLLASHFIPGIQIILFYKHDIITELVTSSSSVSVHPKAIFIMILNEKISNQWLILIHVHVLVAYCHFRICCKHKIHLHVQLRTYD